MKTVGALTAAQLALLPLSGEPPTCVQELCTIRYLRCLQTSSERS
jgi:hypothetical protein